MRDLSFKAQERPRDMRIGSHFSRGRDNQACQIKHVRWALAGPDGQMTPNSYDRTACSPL